MVKNKVRERRRELGMTQAQLAAACGIGQGALSDIEAGVHMPTIYVVLRLAEELMCPVEQLFQLVRKKLNCANPCKSMDKYRHTDIIHYM